MAVKLNKTDWACSICGEVFNTYKEAREHERREHKCLTCENADFDSECVFSCPKLGDCKFPEHSLYKERTDG